MSYTVARPAIRPKTNDENYFNICETRGGSVDVGIQVSSEGFRPRPTSSGYRQHQDYWAKCRRRTPKPSWVVSADLSDCWNSLKRELWCDMNNTRCDHTPVVHKIWTSRFYAPDPSQNTCTFLLYRACDHTPVDYGPVDFKPQVRLTLFCFCTLRVERRYFMSTRRDRSKCLAVVVHGVYCCVVAPAKCARYFATAGVADEPTEHGLDAA